LQHLSVILRRKRLLVGVRVVLVLGGQFFCAQHKVGPCPGHVRLLPAGGIASAATERGQSQQTGQCGTSNRMTTHEGSSPPGKSRYFTPACCAASGSIFFRLTAAASRTSASGSLRAPVRAGTAAFAFGPIRPRASAV